MIHPLKIAELARSLPLVSCLYMLWPNEPGNRRYHVVLDAGKRLSCQSVNKKTTGRSKKRQCHWDKFSGFAIAMSVLSVSGSGAVMMAYCDPLQLLTGSTEPKRCADNRLRSVAIYECQEFAAQLWDIIQGYRSYAIKHKKAKARLLTTKDFCDDQSSIN